MLRLLWSLSLTRLGDGDVVDAAGGAVAPAVLPAGGGGGDGVEGEAGRGGVGGDGGRQGAQLVGAHLVLHAAHALLLADANGVPGAGEGGRIDWWRLITCNFLKTFFFQFLTCTISIPYCWLFK